MGLLWFLNDCNVVGWRGWVWLVVVGLLMDFWIRIMDLLQFCWVWASWGCLEIGFIFFGEEMFVILNLFVGRI